MVKKKIARRTKGNSGNAWKTIAYMQFVIIIILLLLFFVLPYLFNFNLFADITGDGDGDRDCDCVDDWEWNGLCTNLPAWLIAILDECCDEYEPYEPPEGISCPNLDPDEIPYNDYPYWYLEVEMGYDLVAACAEGECPTDEVCRPLLYFDEDKADWFFEECTCFEQTSETCNGMTSESQCIQHYCMGTEDFQEGYVKRCTWYEDPVVPEFSYCYCPFDPQ